MAQMTKRERVLRTVHLQEIIATGGIGYFLGSITELHWEIPTANILAMFEAAWCASSRGGS